MRASVDTPAQYFRYRSTPMSGPECGSSVLTVLAQWEKFDGRVLQEATVSLIINGQLWLELLCTPTDLEALAMGYLFNEGWIQSSTEVTSLKASANGEKVEIRLTHGLALPALWNFDEMDQPAIRKFNDPWTMPPERILELQTGLPHEQGLSFRIGGMHTSILSDSEAALARAEDAGRLNTLDKLAGQLLLERLDPQRRILLTTGRISSGMVQKTYRMRAAMLVSRSTPSAASIHMAQDLGITLIGCVRRDQFNIYTHTERVEGAR
jgi:FdhD protein